MTEEKQKLRLQLQDQDYVVRRQAAMTLCDLAHLGRVEEPDIPAVLTVLLETLNDPDGWGPNAAFSIGRIGPLAQAAIPALIEQLQNQNRSDSMVHNVCHALGEMDKLAAAAVVPMIELLSDPKLSNFDTVLCTLGNMGDSASSAVPLITELLSHPNSMVRGYAAVALGGIGKASVTALPKLIELLNDPIGPTSMLAAVGLRGMKELAYEAVPALIQALQHPDPDVWCAVIMTLVAIDEPAQLGSVEVAELINRASSSELELLAFWLYPLEGDSPSWAYLAVSQ
jgi:HEAT repeat protein